ncbi:transmembrane protein 233-like isoform X1 [Denticeps clupeoides]|uniref:transmembrane protein 233-like isoform X1 n=1 Tax=Denticeps clupeoides TaxID=299321 RepID=UPI0010A49D32|nr:transmembrane protein 233-like isoform X1 [Denticeps clupeoides]
MDAEYGKGAPGEIGAAHPSSCRDTQQLLKQPDSLSLALRAAGGSPDAGRDARRSPGSPPPRSCSPDAPAPPTYLWLAIVSCFCPGYPFNIFAIYYAHTSRTMLQVGDVDGARRRGRTACFLAFIAMAVGLFIALYVIIKVETTRK